MSHWVGGQSLERNERERGRKNANQLANCKKAISLEWIKTRLNKREREGHGRETALEYKIQKILWNDICILKDYQREYI